VAVDRIRLLVSVVDCPDTPLISHELNMERYVNRGGDSGITAYEIAEESILVEFRDGSQYLYTYSATGRSNVETMKKLARRGEGLNEFINGQARKAYARKVR